MWPKQGTNVRSGEFLTSFNKNYRVNGSAVEKYNEAFRGDYFLTILEKNKTKQKQTKKNKSNVVLVVVLIIESKVYILYFKW